MTVTMQISGHGLELTPALKEYAEKKLAHLLSRDESTDSIHLVLVCERHRQRAEATVHSRRGAAHAEAEGEDMYAAIDLLETKLLRQIVREKERHVDHHPERHDGNGLD
jgi:putative sigma-54 modulation protein